MTSAVRTRAANGDRGAVIPMVALSLVVLIAMTAFSIDLGRQSLRRRQAQATGDMAAFDLSMLINGSDTQTIEADSRWSQTQIDAADRNSFPPSGVSAVLGTWDQPTMTFTPTAATEVPNAVRVTTTDSVSFYFAPVIGMSGSSVTRHAVATSFPSACFEVGSFAAAFDSSQATVMPDLVNSILKTNLTAVSYQGLANAQVNIGELAAQLGFGDRTQFLTANVTLSDLVSATATLLQQHGDTADATVLSAALPSVPAVGFQVSNVIYAYGQTGMEAALTSAINVADLLSGAAFVANGSNAISIPTLVLNVPGVATSSMSATAIESPQKACGPLGTPATTSQVNDTITMLLVGGDTIDLNFQVAHTTGKLVDPLACPSPAQINVSVAGTLFTNSIVDHSPTLGDMTVTPPTQTVGNDTVSFLIPPDSYNQYKRTGSGYPGFTGTSITGLPADVQTVLNAAFPVIDSMIVNPTMQALGLEVAGADVAAIPFTGQCIGRNLVQ